MGNLLAALGSTLIPLMSEVLIVPTLFAPDPSVPWVAPSWFTIRALTLVVEVILVIILSTFNGVMNSLRTCNRMELWESFKNSKWALTGYFLYAVFFLIFGMLKVPVQNYLSWLPYSRLLIDGLLYFPFSLIFGALGNIRLRNKVC